MALNAGISVTNFMLAIDGVAGGFLNSFTGPDMEADLIKIPLGPDGRSPQAHGNLKYSDPKWSFAFSHVGPLWNIMNSVLQKQCVQFQARVDLANQNYESMRACEMIDCLITEIGWSKLDGKDGKGVFEATMTSKCENVKYLKGDKKKLQATAKNNAKRMLKSNFRVALPGGLKSESVTSCELPKLSAKTGVENFGGQRLGTLHYTAWEVGNTKTEHSHTDYDGVLAYVQKIIGDGEINPDSDYAAITAELLSLNLKDTLATFAMDGCAPYKFKWGQEFKGGTDGQAMCTVDWTTEGLTLTPPSHAD